jgi:glycine/D-amino acid oxidase-like deaminating enzyme
MLETPITEVEVEEPPAVTFRERPVKVIIVGAGIGGIATAVLLSRKVNNLTYTIYDRNDKVGGTWAENRYPGVRCMLMTGRPLFIRSRVVPCAN